MPRLYRARLLHPVIADSELQGVDAWIGNRHPRIGDMHIFEIQGDRTLFASEDMHSQRRLRGEIDIRGAKWHLSIGEKHTSAQFHVRSQALAASKIPLHHKR